MPRVKETRAEAAKRVEPELEARDETAHALGIHIRSVDRLLKDGKLRGVKIGRRQLVVIASRKALAAGR
jgi:hypothetical protein